MESDVSNYARSRCLELRHLSKLSTTFVGKYKAENFVEVVEGLLQTN